MRHCEKLFLQTAKSVLLTELQKQSFRFLADRTVTQYDRLLPAGFCEGVSGVDSAL